MTPLTFTGATSKAIAFRIRHSLETLVRADRRVVLLASGRHAQITEPEMSLRRLGRTDIEIAPLVLGTNVVGWTADETTSFAVFDAFVAEGFSAIDTADSYSRWVPGNDSDSEKIIGRWLKARGNRDRVHVFTKVGSDMGQGRTDLSAKWIEEEVEASLTRLQTDYIDLYQSHWPDKAVTQEETLARL